MGEGVELVGWRRIQIGSLAAKAANFLIAGEKFAPLVPISDYIIVCWHAAAHTTARYRPKTTH
jgi:ribosomal protein L13